MGTLITTAAAQAGSFPTAEKSERRLLAAQLKAARFLTMASFGPTQAEIDALAAEILSRGQNKAFSAWIDAQFALPPNFHEPLAKQMILDDGFPSFIDENISTSNYRQYAWWHRTLTAPDQLRQRVAWALAQIFVINRFGDGFGSRELEVATGEPQYLGIVNYYDMLLRHAFGNYRALLGDVSLHPVMGGFLSHVNNPKATETTEPDENYAREVQQLFSIGLYELKPNGQIRTDQQGLPIASYDNADIRAFARVFTGLGFAGAPRFGSNQRNFHQPMVMYEEFHDTEPKTLHNGTVLPAGQSGMADINAALDNLFQHPNTGPFIARLLIQRLVKSNPSKGYIRSVAKAFAGKNKSQRGDFKAVIKAILLHKEALKRYQVKKGPGPVVMANGSGTEHARLQEPILRYAAFLRAFSPSTEHPAGYYAIGNLSGSLNQAPYYSPSVFNFYLPDHTPAGELQKQETSRKIPNRSLHAPEFQVLTSVAANEIGNRFRSDLIDGRVDLSSKDVNGPFSFDLVFDFSAQEARSHDPEALLRDLNLLLCRGLLEDGSLQVLAQILREETEDVKYRSRGAILALLMAPDCAIHE